MTRVDALNRSTNHASPLDTPSDAPAASGARGGRWAGGRASGVQQAESDLSSHGIRLAFSADDDVVLQASVDADSLFQRDAAELIGHRLDAILPGHADWLGNLIADLADGEARRISLRMAAGTIDGVLRHRHGTTSLALRPRGNRQETGHDGGTAATARLARPLGPATTTRRLAALLARRIAEATGFRRVLVTRSSDAAIDEIIADHSLVVPRAPASGSGSEERIGSIRRAAKPRPAIGTTLACMIVVDGREWGRLLCQDDVVRAIPWTLWEAIPRAVEAAARQIEACLARGEPSAEIHHILRRPTRAAAMTPTAVVAGNPPGPPNARRSPYAQLSMLLRGRVLVADGSRTHRADAEMALREAGFDVTFAPSNASAADMALAGNFDLILIDAEMRCAEGMEAVLRLRAQPKTLYLPVIAVTAAGDSDNFARLLEAGIDDHLAKPVSAAKLVAIASRWIDRYRERQRAIGVEPTNDDAPSGRLSPLTAFLDGSGPLLERVVRAAVPLPDDSTDPAAISRDPLGRVREISVALDAARQVGRTDHLAELAVELQRAWRPVAASIAAVIKTVARSS